MKTKNPFMKNILTLTILISLSLTSFANTYYIHTAKATGNWNNTAIWNKVVRTDNVSKDKFIIPAAFNVTGDNDVNSLGYDNVELQISGKLIIGNSAILSFGNDSKIEILSTGSIVGNGNSQQILIGGVSKYVGNKDKTITGPLYADFSTPSSPNGFVAYTLLAINDRNAETIGQTTNRNKEMVNIYSSNKTISIAFASNNINTVTVKIMNINGNVVSSQLINRPAATVKVNTQNLNSGIYVVYVADQNNIVTVKKVFVN